MFGNFHARSLYLCVRCIMVAGLSLVNGILASPAALAQTPAPPKKIVVVASADVQQRPFIFTDGSGLTLDLLNALNDHQDQFSFRHEVMSVHRQMRSLQEDGSVHVAALHNIQWGWQRDKVETSYDLLTARDTFVALKGPTRGQSYFDGFGVRLSIGVLGYHYRFANYNSEQKFLKEKFNLETVESELGVLDMLLLGRGNIGLVSTTTLDYLAGHDRMKLNRFLISEKYDDEYRRHFVLAKTAPIKAAQFNQLLRELDAKDELAKIFQRYGLSAPTLPKQ